MKPAGWTEAVIIGTVFVASIDAYGNHSSTGLGLQVHF